MLKPIFANIHGCWINCNFLIPSIFIGMKKGISHPLEYIESLETWRHGILAVHHLLLELGFDADVKWGMPVYSFEGTNLVGISKHKQFLTFMMFQGAVLSDPLKLLVNAQEGKTKAMRQWRFYHPDDLDLNVFRQYFEEVIAQHQSGARVEVDRSRPKLEIPALLSQALAENTELNDCFQSLTYFKQKEFAEYISEAKRDATKLSRLEKIRTLILDGKGLHDKYR